MQWLFFTETVQQACDKSDEDDVIDMAFEDDIEANETSSTVCKDIHNTSDKELFTKTAKALQIGNRFNSRISRIWQS